MVVGRPDEVTQWVAGYADLKINRYISVYDLSIEVKLSLLHLCQEQTL